MQVDPWLFFTKTKQDMYYSVLNAGTAEAGGTGGGGQGHPAEDEQKSADSQGAVQGTQGKMGAGTLS